MKEKSTIPRREFLKQTGIAGVAIMTAAPNLFLNKVKAATGESPNELIRVGFIGAGGRGRGLMSHPYMRKHVVAVCDVDKNHLAAAKKLIQRLTGVEVQTYGDFRKLLENKEIDAVVVATPDHWHALPVIYACMAGKDVYVEKPMTLTIHEGWAMIKAARKYNRIVQVGSQQSSDSRFRRACEYVRSGRIGKIRMIRVGLPGVNWTREPPVPDGPPPPELDYNFWLGPAPWRPYNKHRVHYYFRFFWDYSGGQLTNWGAHHLDIVQWALGMDQSGPVEISARYEYDPLGRYEVPSWFEITYKYANGVTVLCGQSHRMGVTFEGQDGLIYVTRGKLECTVPEVLKEPLGPNEVHLYESKNHILNWFDCIKSRKLPIADVAIGHRSATVCHLGNIAVRTGHTIRWDPKAERIIDDPAAETLVSKVYRAPWKLPEL